VIEVTKEIKANLEIWDRWGLRDQMDAPGLMARMVNQAKMETKVRPQLKCLFIKLNVFNFVLL